MMRALLMLLPVTVAICCAGGQQGSDPQAGPVACATNCPEVDPTAPLGEVVDGPEWLTGAHPEEFPAETFSLGVGIGLDPELAKKAAEEALALALWGPPEEVPDVELPPLFDPEKDGKKSELLSNGQAAVLLAVSRPLYALRIQTWLDSPPAAKTHDVSKPGGMLAATLSFLRFGQRHAFACLRLAALVEHECEPTDTTMARRQVASVARELKLEAAMRGGIPHRPGGLPYTPARVRVTWTNAAGEVVPWPALPILFKAPEGVLEMDTATTDADGYAEVAIVGLPMPRESESESETEVDEPDGLRAAVAREALLGRSAELWPQLAVELDLRPVTLDSGRIAVFLRDHISHEVLEEPVAAPATAQALVDLGYAGAHLLELEEAKGLVDKKGPDLVTALRAIADGSHGAVDQIVVGTAHSDFASRMSSRSVWHEAAVSLRIYDAWSGKQIGEVNRSTRARGIGDYNAGRNALQALGTLAAEALHQLLQTKSSGDV